MKIAAYILGVIIILATAIPIIPAGIWWIRALDAPRVQIIFLSLVAIGLFIWLFYKKDLFKNLSFKIIGSLLLPSVIYQLYMIFPFTPLYTKTVEDSVTGDVNRKLTFMLANVYMDNKESGKLIEIINANDPDVIVVTEPNKWWEEQLKPIENEYIYSSKIPLENTYGMLLYSKLPLVSPEVKFIVKNDIPSIFTRLVLRSNDTINLYCVHPEPPRPDVDVNDRDAELLLAGKEAKSSPLPDIVAGDLNDVAWSHTNDLFQEISGLLDPRKGRGFFNTFNAHYFFLRWSLDHVYFSRTFRLSDIKTLQYFGSDHFPMLVTVTYEPELQHEQDPPHAEDDDKKEADEKIEKGK